MFLISYHKQKRSFMAGESALNVLLKSMQPYLVEGTYVFCTSKTLSLEEAVSLRPKATFIEEEGLTLVLEKEMALHHALDFEGEFSLISLKVHSSLEAVGLTAAFANCLKEQGISANVIAGYYHDHIFVPKQRAQEALAALHALAKKV